jgi:hypothetical protein
VLIVGAEQETELVTSLQKTRKIDTHFRRIYRDILQSTDPIARFMLLYMLLMTVIGKDNQASVDNWIRKHQPGVVETKHPLKSYMETIYTRLRNEVAHGSERKVPIEKTRSEINQNIEVFQNLVKRALLK